MVLVPQGADQVWSAPRCEARGVGVGLTPETLSPESLRKAVNEVLSVPSYRAAAQEVSTEIEGMPPITTVVPLIERVADTKSPLRR